MAISVKDIQEKEFTAVSDNGYSMEQVDDFLDELAEEWGALIRENLSLSGQVEKLQGELSAAQAANAEMEKKLPDYNEKGYFKNLEAAIRESLIGAQRIADEAVADAKRQAKQAVDDANASAEKTVADANASAEKTVADANARAEQTVADANARAEQTVADADAHAKSITEAAEQTVSRLTTEADQLRNTIEEYKTKLKSLLTTL